jgi:hypothetical protein
VRSISASRITGGIPSPLACAGMAANKDRTANNETANNETKILRISAFLFSGRLTLFAARRLSRIPAYYKKIILPRRLRQRPGCACWH